MKLRNYVVEKMPEKLGYKLNSREKGHPPEEIYQMALNKVGPCASQLCTLCAAQYQAPWASLWAATQPPPWPGFPSLSFLVSRLAFPSSVFL